MVFLTCCTCVYAKRTQIIQVSGSQGSEGSDWSHLGCNTVLILWVDTNVLNDNSALTSGHREVLQLNANISEEHTASKYMGLLVSKPIVHNTYLISSINEK
jgi:hypothetical protein